MNALYVNACAREGSRTRRLCEAYTRKYWQGPDVDVRELEVFKAPLAPLDAEGLLKRDRDIAAGELSGEEYRLAREFAGADEILMGAPYWDCSFPAVLKIYLERICVNGIAFRYGEDGRPVKLCAAKKLVYITTAGGYLPAESSLELYLRELCGLLCIPELRFIKAEGLDIWGNDPEKLLREAIRGI